MHDLTDRSRFHTRIDVAFTCSDAYLRFFGC